MEPFSSYRVSLPCLDMKICSWYCKLVGCVQRISLGSLLISEKNKWRSGESEIKAGWGWWKEWNEEKLQTGLLYEKEYIKIKINQRLSSWSRLMFEEEGKRVYSIMHLEWNPNVKNVRFFLFVSCVCESVNVTALYQDSDFSPWRSHWKFAFEMLLSSHSTPFA